MDTVCSDTSPSMITVENWFDWFQRGHMSDFHESRSGVPKMVTAEENVTLVHVLVLTDLWFTVCKIAETVGLLKYWRVHIPHELLGMKKLSVRLLSRFLTRTRRTTVRKVQSSVWCCISAIRRRCFCSFLWHSTRYVSTCTDQRPRNSRNSRFHPAFVLQRSGRLSNRLEKWWQPFSAISKVSSTLATWIWVKPTHGCTMPNYWAELTSSRRKTVPFRAGNGSCLPLQRRSLYLGPLHRQFGLTGLETAAHSMSFAK